MSSAVWLFGIWRKSLGSSRDLLFFDVKYWSSGAVPIIAVAGYHAILGYSCVVKEYSRTAVAYILHCNIIHKITHTNCTILHILGNLIALFYIPIVISPLVNR